MQLPLATWLLPDTVDDAMLLLRDSRSGDSGTAGAGAAAAGAEETDKGSTTAGSTAAALISFLSRPILSALAEAGRAEDFLRRARGGIRLVGVGSVELLLLLLQLMSASGGGCGLGF